MHEILFWFAAPGDPSNGTNNNDILVAIVGVVGTLASVGLTAFVTSFRREKTPNATVDSIESEQDIRREKVWTDQIQSLTEDLDVSNRDKDNYLRLYQKLREAVWAKGLNPDTLMAELS